MRKRIVDVPDLEDANRFGYSQCISAGETVFLAGQCGIGHDREVVSPEFEPQARQALERVRLAVEAAGGTLRDIVSTTVFITDIRYGARFSEIRAEHFEGDLPASTLVAVSALMPLNAMVEVQATAVIGSGE